MIISVVGKKGSGKTTALNYFKLLGFKTLEIHDAYHNLLKENVLEKEDIIPKDVWGDAYAKVIHKYLLKDTIDDIVFLGGLLRPIEFNFLKMHHDVLSVAISVENNSERYRRMRERGRNNEANYSDEDFSLRDANRSGTSKEKYKENNIDKLIEEANIVISNNGHPSEFNERLFEVGLYIGGYIQKGSSWYDDPKRYVYSNYSKLFKLEALLGGRKKIINSLGEFNSAVALGCNDGSELELIQAKKLIGVDINRIWSDPLKNKGKFSIICTDLFNFKGNYDLSTLLRVIGGTQINTEKALEKTLKLSKKVSLISIATGGITKEGKLKKYGVVLGGKMNLEEYIVNCRSYLQKLSNVEEITTPFEHYFICKKI